MKQRYKTLFRELVASGAIAEVCERRTLMNIPFWTLGGEVCWDWYRTGGWQLQINNIFGNWRVLDPDGTRRAWGWTEEELESFLNDRPISVFSNYRAEGYSFARYPGKGGATAVLIHGWGVRARSMDGLARMLQQAGYSVLNYDYPSSEQGIEDHAEIFLERYRVELPTGKIVFLTHSMGGLILRYVLAKMSEAECRAIDSIVMLGPPNQGSLLALLSQAEVVRLFNASLGDMAPGAEALRIPAPAHLPPVGIVAGTLDGKVSLASTSLPAGMPFERTEVVCTHPGLRDPDNTGALILHFFRHKTFDR